MSNYCEINRKLTFILDKQARNSNQSTEGTEIRAKI